MRNNHRADLELLGLEVGLDRVVVPETLHRWKTGVGSGGDSINNFLGANVKTLLSIDYDFWAEPAEWTDWGHRESPMFIDSIWPFRGATFIAQGKSPERMVHLPPDEPSPSEAFLTIGGSPKFAVAESHAAAFDFFKQLDGKYHLINIDAHHDFGYAGNVMRVLDCGNWVAHLVEAGRVGTITQIYPKWRKRVDWEDDWTSLAKLQAASWQKLGINVEVKYGLDTYRKAKLPHRHAAAFLCRSGAWVPPWLDGDFINLAVGVGMAGGGSEYTIYHHKRLEDFRREWDVEGVKKLGAEQKKRVEEMRGGGPICAGRINA